MKRSAAPRLLLIALLWWQAPALAQDANAASESADSTPTQQGDREAQLEWARELFQEGLQLVEAERWAEAEARFRAVLATRSSAVAQYNLASTLVHQGKLLEATELLRAVARDETAGEDTRTVARQLLSETEPQIGSITVRLAGPLDRAELSVDERMLAVARLQSLSVDPGEHVVATRRDGVELERHSIDVGGEHALKAELELTLPPLPEGPATVPVPAPRRAMQPSDINGDGGSAQAADDSTSVVASPWLWAGAAVVAATVVVVALAAGGSTQADPVQGDTDPPVFRGVVMP